MRVRWGCGEVGERGYVYTFIYLYIPLNTPEYLYILIYTPIYIKIFNIRKMGSGTRSQNGHNSGPRESPSGGNKRDYLTYDFSTFFKVGNVCGLNVYISCWSVAECL